MDGEERFGPVSSVGYWLSAKLPPVSGFHRFVVEDVRKRGFRSMLDVGTGPGNVPMAIARSVSNGRIYAVDPSEGMVRLSRMRPGAKGIEFRLGSSRHLPFKMKFDLIITALSFHHWAKKAYSLRYLSRFLAKGGEMRIYEFDKDRLYPIVKQIFESHSMSKDELYAVASESGLRVKNILQARGFIRATLVR